MGGGAVCIQVPSWIVMVPAPTGASAVAMAVEATDWARASCCTLMPNEVALAMPVTDADTAALLVEVTDMPFQALSRVSFAAASDSVDMSDFTCE